MPTFAATLKSEIRRLAAREAKKALRSLRRLQRHVKALRLASRGQRRSLASLEGRLERLKARARGTAPGRRGRRLSPESIKSLRSRLGMTRVQFAKLVGVSPGSIFGWETGRTTPRSRSLARLAEVRKTGVRALRARVQAAPKRRGRRRARRGRRK